MRSSDIICRHGGEEFLLVFTETNIEMAEQRAEEIRWLVGQSVIDYEGHSLKATISLGMAVFPNHGIKAEELTIKADKAMYCSKQTGRNRQTIWYPGLD